MSTISRHNRRRLPQLPTWMQAIVFVGPWVLLPTMPLAAITLWALGYT